MNMYVGITDEDWYRQLSQQNFDEVNFWKPGGTKHFRALRENEMFLFKLRYPMNAIVGGGFFASFSFLPPYLAWDVFGEKNGVRSAEELMERSQRLSKGVVIPSRNIGCIILTDPFWFSEDEWIPMTGWARSTVQGKIYDTDMIEGRRLYEQVQERLRAERCSLSMTKHRLGEGGFRIAVTDAYQRRCAITGEKTLPVLEAAHIRPYASDGPHLVSNGLLFRSDLHTLFDRGYITVTPDRVVEVSRRLHEDFGNGRDYYRYHGTPLLVVPEQAEQMPDRQYLEWHNTNVYLG